MTGGDRVFAIKLEFNEIRIGVDLHPRLNIESEAWFLE